MNQKLSSVMFFVLVAISQGSINSARAECYTPYNSAGNNPVDGGRYVGTITLDRNETCERRPTSLPVDLQYVGGRIIQRAKHGMAGANGETLAYRPAKDYVGPDEFMVEVQFRKNDQAGKYTVHYTVTVK